MKKLVLAILLIFIFSFTCFFTFNSESLFADASSRVDPTEEYQGQPEIFANKIVWTDFRNGVLHQIYIYDISTGTSTPLYPTDRDQWSPDIYENYVVWVENVREPGIPQYQVYLYDIDNPSVSPVRICTTNCHQTFPEIYGDKIVWADWRFGMENTQIYVYDITNDTTTRINPTDSKQDRPLIFEDKIIFSDNIDYLDTDPNIDQIYLYDMSYDTITRIDPTGSDQVPFSFYGNKAIWADSRNEGIYQIYMNDITTGATNRLYPTVNMQWDAKISANKVVWSENSQIYLCDINSGSSAIRVDPTTERQFGPDVYGNKVAWSDGRDLLDNTGQIYILELPLELSPSVIEVIYERIKNSFRFDRFLPRDFTEIMNRSVPDFINKAIDFFNNLTGRNFRRVAGFPEKGEISTDEFEMIALEKEALLKEAPVEEAEAETEPELEEGVAEEGEEKRPMTAPYVELEIYEGPEYIDDEGICYYRVAANVTGDPEPELDFSRDDSSGELGENKIQINLGSPSETCTLVCTATNPAGEDTDSIEITWGCIEMHRVYEAVPSNTVILHPSDIGYLVYPSGVNTETLIMGLDSISNTGVEGFFAFDLSSLSGKSVNSATMRLETYRTYGNYWGGGIMGRIRIGPINYLPLDPQDYFKPSDSDPYFHEFVFDWNPNYVIEFSTLDLKKSVQDAIDGGNKLQCYFVSMVVGDTDLDNQTDGREYTKDTISLILEVAD